MPKYTADLHTHIDYDDVRKRRHGIHPKEIARAMIDARLDICVTLEHNNISERHFDVQDELKKISEQERLKILCLLGIEVTVKFGGLMYHVGVIFEEKFHRRNLPAIPDRRLDLRLLDEYMMDYPSVAVVFHPTWQYWKTNGEGLDVTQNLLLSGLVDGAEILNGSILFNGQGSKHQIKKKAATPKGLELFLKVREINNQLSPIGSSDAHSPCLVGSVRTEFEAGDPRGIFEAVKRGNTRAVAYEQGTIMPKIRGLQIQIPGISQYIGYKNR